MKEEKQVDVAIIGTGTAGMNAYRAAREYTDRIALIEGGHYGTTCARVGCMPSKLLIAAAEAAHTASHTSLFGVGVSGINVDGPAVMARVQSERDRFVGFVVEAVESYDDSHKIRGMAKFIDDHTLEVGNHTRISAKRIIIATGSRPNGIPLANTIGDLLLTHETVFELPDIPESLLVLGSGVIGLELGQAFARLGSKVTVLGRSESLAGSSDPEIREYAKGVFSEELTLELSSELISLVREGSKVNVVYRNQHGERVNQTVSYVLAASGHIPNIDHLGLENTTLQRQANGVPVFDPLTMQANPPHIFIAGDATHTQTLLHEASDEGRIAGENAGAYPNSVPARRRAPISIVFTDPQLMQVGHTLQELTALPDQRMAVGRVSFEDQGRSRVMGKNKGLLKVFADPSTGRFLGAEMIGPAAEHIAHLLAWSFQQSMTIPQMLSMPFYHPVIEEGLRTALRDVSLDF